MICGSRAVIKYLLFTLSLFAGCSPSWAINPTDPRDPNCIFAVDFREGRDGIARDMSQSKLDVKLNGITWYESDQVFQQFSDFSYQIQPSSLTYAPVFGHGVFMTPTTGIDAETISTTTAFNFNGNRPFMMAWVVWSRLKGNVGVQTSVFSYTQAANACGFSLEYAAGTVINGNFVLTGVGGPIFWPTTRSDTVPHMYWIWRDESGHVVIGYDGKRTREFTGVADFNTCSGGSQLVFGRAKTGAAGEFGGGFGPFWIWNKAVEKANLDNFMKSWYDALFD